MANRNRLSRSRIIVGLDYGTTYTGLAWMEVQGGLVPPLSELKAFKYWPEKETQKVPSDLSYSESAGERKQWGHDIDNESLVMRWTKLDLEPRTVGKELEVLGDLMKGLDLIKEFQQTARNIPQHLARNASDVVRDYLTKVVREWYLWMQSQEGPRKNILKSVPLDLVITHPASWSYNALNKTYRAIMAAFSNFETLDRVFFTSEPEACALYTIEDLSRQELLDRLIKGDCFILCDAGGGTVDVVSYQLESITPLKIKKIGEVAGRRCGATYVDRAFLKWLEPKVEALNVSPQDVGTGGHFIMTDRGRNLLQRFERVKHAFDGELHGEVQLHRDTVIRPGHEESVINKKVMLTKEDLQMMFSESVKGSIELIRRQVTGLQNPGPGKTPYLVTHIFLAGGFAESPYLFNEVKKYASKNSLILRRAEDCWSGVVRGAVLAGMGLAAEMPTGVIPCPRHYGFCVNLPHVNRKSNEIAPTQSKYCGTPMAPGQVVWLIRKNDAIVSGSPIIATFGLRHRFSMSSNSTMKLSVIFVATGLEIAPSNISKVPPETNEIMPLEIELAQFRCCVKPYRGPGLFNSYNTVDLVAELRVDRGEFTTTVDPKEVTATLKCNCKTQTKYITTL